MRYSIDFSIFSSPTEAYGNVKGEIEFPSTPALGQVVELVDGKRLRITSLCTEMEGWVGSVVGLDDIVFDSKADAREFAIRLEKELDLFVVPYDDDDE